MKIKKNLSAKRESKPAHQTTQHLAKLELESECDGLEGELDDTIGGLEVVKASLDLTGKYPNTNKGTSICLKI